MPVLAAVMMPHPPMILPEVGRGSERSIRQTAEACRQATRFLKDREPESLILISPHSAMYADWFHLSPGLGAQGNMGRFGASQVGIQVDYDIELVREIERLAQEAGIPAGRDGERQAALDHASLVPLYFLKEAYGGSLPFKVVRLGLSGLDYRTHYRLGVLIAEAAQALGRRIAVLASGDLSHYLKEDGPYGLRPEGAEYDAQLMNIMGRGAFDELLRLPESLCERAGECGQRSFVIMAGCLDGLKVEARALSYQDVTGVGYGVCTFEPLGEDANRRFLGEPESAPVKLARASIEHRIKTGRRMARPDALPDWLLSRRAGAFVTLHKAGRLRGCIGTIAPTRACLADEIMENALSAALRDPRFAPVKEAELKELSYSVDVLDAPEDIASIEALDPQRYGVIVSRGSRRGLLLPMLDGVDTVDLQVRIAREKAGIGPDEPVTLQRFQVTRYL